MSSEYAAGVGGWAPTQGGDPILEKVRALWASSMDESYPAELRESYRLRAEALAFQHRIDLIQEGNKTAAGLDPEWRHFVIASIDSEYVDTYRLIAYTLGNHCGLRMMFDRSEGKLRVEAAGYPGDLGYFDILLTSCLMAFGGKLEPAWDTGLSLDENIYRLRAAGWERGRIARKAWPEQYVGLYPGHVNKTLNKRVTAIYEREAKKRSESTDGISGRGVQAGTYRTSYAEAFGDELWSRLYRMRVARGAKEKGLVMANAKERIDEAFYTRYPGLRPAPLKPGGGISEYKAPNADCERCKKAKSGYCREHGYLRPRKLAERPLSAAGYAQGQRAAQSIDLGTVQEARVGADSGRREVEG